ncbi:MAG: toll/interleukin-1 receptor domain-containing protein, partial [Anaerolineae bacterium]|nr:toll/interleukin-1 receptor domain-containing protein [Anaerolineae bacterium]
MAHIFISYSRTDIEIARQLKKRLEARAFKVWMDETDISAGDILWRAIEQAIDDCTALIVLVSPRSTKSEWVEREVLCAERKHKPILPILIEGEEWSRLADIHHADMRTGVPDDLPETLLQNLQTAGAAQRTEPKPNTASVLYGPLAALSRKKIPRWVDYLV